MGTYLGGEILVTWKQRGTVAAALPLRRYSGIPRPALPFSFCDFFLVSTSAAGKVNFAWPARVHRINRSTREQAPSSGDIDSPGAITCRVAHFGHRSSARGSSLG